MAPLSKCTGRSAGVVEIVGPPDRVAEQDHERSLEPRTIAKERAGRSLAVGAEPENADVLASRYLALSAELTPYYSLETGNVAGTTRTRFR